MSGWNYRIVRHEGYYGLHEVYYDEDGNIVGWALEPDTIGNDPKDLIEGLKLMLSDAEKDQPVLDLEDLPTGEPDEAA